MKNFSILVGHNLLTTFLEDCNNLLSKQTFLMLFLHPSISKACSIFTGKIGGVVAAAAAVPFSDTMLSRSEV
jgi:hypothetical protein